MRGPSGAAARIPRSPIKIRGFKSFADPLELSLEPGVAVVVGPNGSGKSNIADAVVWAAGSLTPSELRAEKPDDVLFAGGGDRKPAAHCEVELVFDNEDGAFDELDFSEVSITRRLVRGAEGQYLVNRAAVRRTDLVEILADVGLGSAMHSIVGQGKVEQVLASKPEDRRALVEEAAGPRQVQAPPAPRRAEARPRRRAGRARARRRGRGRSASARSRCRRPPPSARRSSASRSRRFTPASPSSISRTPTRRRSEAEGARDAAALARRGAQSRLEGLLADRARAEDELSDAAGRRESAVAALYRLQGASSASRSAASRRPSSSSAFGTSSGRCRRRWPRTPTPRGSSGPRASGAGGAHGRPRA